MDNEPKAIWNQSAGGRDNVLSQVLCVSEYSNRKRLYFPPQSVSLAVVLVITSDCTVLNTQKSVWGGAKEKSKLNVGLQFECFPHKPECLNAGDFTEMFGMI